MPRDRSLARAVPRGGQAAPRGGQAVPRGGQAVPRDRSLARARLGTPPAKQWDNAVESGKEQEPGSKSSGMVNHHQYTHKGSTGSRSPFAAARPGVAEYAPAAAAAAAAAASVGDVFDGDDGTPSQWQAAGDALHALMDMSAGEAANAGV